MRNVVVLDQAEGKEALPPSVILSFDVEEHWRIEAASHLALPEATRTYHAGRVAGSTRWLLEALAEQGVSATFFLVGELAQAQPDLVRAIHRDGHEVASHGWDHRNVQRMTPAEFQRDIRQSKDTLEQIIGQPVVGYRAPTFSIVSQTTWALSLLREEGYLYDSSIYPVCHDRYGIPTAPRGLFRVGEPEASLLEIPPVRLDLPGLNLPMGGGGYFRLFPLGLMRWAIAQTHASQAVPVAMLYFHPWEFDPDQTPLPLGALSRWRTYVGLRRSRDRLRALLPDYHFVRAVDVLEAVGATPTPFAAVS